MEAILNNNEFLKAYNDYWKDKEAITKGCSSSKQGCFCTGKCKKVIGYREKGKAVYFNEKDELERKEEIKGYSKININK
jgi:hypothetical protein